VKVLYTKLAPIKSADFSSLP